MVNSFKRYNKCRVHRLNKKGSVMDGILWMIIAFITVLFLAMWMYAHNVLTQKMLEVPNQDFVNATGATMVKVNTAMQNWLPTIAFFIIFGMIIEVFITNFLIKGNPIYFVIHIFVIIVAVPVASILSNRYMELLDNGLIGNSLQSFTAVNYIMQWLPYFVVVVGILGAIFLFINVTRNEDYDTRGEI